MVRVDADGFALAADWAALTSPETYLGFAHGERRVADGTQLALNQWKLAGEWEIGKESAVLDAAAGSIVYRFKARDVNLVMAPPANGEAVRFTARLDDEPLGADHGLDVDESGAGVLSEPRMYQLVRQRQPVRQRNFEITFAGEAVSAYVFTFGWSPFARAAVALLRSHARFHPGGPA